MLRLRRAGPYGKILEVYRGKKTKFADLESTTTSIDIKGDIVDPNANLLYPYSEENEQECKESKLLYSKLVESMSRQIMRTLAKKSRAITKRSQIKTTISERQSLPQVEKSAAKEETNIDVSHEDGLSPRFAPQEETDSLINSMFATVSESDMLQLLQSLQHSQADDDKQSDDDDEDLNDNEEDDEEKQEDDDCDDIDRKQDEEDGESGWPKDDQEDFERTKNDQFTSTLYEDDTVVESGPIDQEQLESDDEAHLNSASDSSSDDDPFFTDVSVDDDTNLFMDMDDTPIADEDFCMYDGLGEFYDAP